MEKRLDQGHKRISFVLYVLLALLTFCVSVGIVHLNYPIWAALLCIIPLAVVFVVNLCGK